MSPRVLAGYPVIAGTRVPYDVVDGLADAGVTIAEIIEMYSSVVTDSIEDVSDFVEQIAKAV